MFLSSHFSRHPIGVRVLLWTCCIQAGNSHRLFLCDHKPLYTSLLKSKRLGQTLCSSSPQMTPSSDIFTQFHTDPHDTFFHNNSFWNLHAHVRHLFSYSPNPFQNPSGLMHGLDAVLISTIVAAIKIQLSSPDYNSVFNSSIYGSQQLHTTRMSNWGTACVCCPLSFFFFFYFADVMQWFCPFFSLRREWTQGRRDRPEKLWHHSPAHHQADHWPGEIKEKPV